MYRDIIKEFSPHHDPRHIRAYMLDRFSTLDYLTIGDFKRQARECQLMVDADPELAEKLAQSFGL